VKDAWKSVPTTINACLDTGTTWDRLNNTIPRARALIQPDGEEFDVQSQLVALLAEPRWRRASYDLLREAAHSSRRVMGVWVPALSLSSRGVEVLTDLSSQLKDFDDLARRLRTFGAWDDVDYRQSFALEWIRIQSNATLFHEWLMSAGTGGEYFSVGRAYLPPQIRTLLPSLPGGGRRPCRLELKPGGILVVGSWQP
jgi:hypothetical protein